MIAAGGLLVVGAFTGGVRWLIVPALALAFGAAAAAAVDIDVRGGTGEGVYRPATAADCAASTSWARATCCSICETRASARVITASA